MLWAPEERVNNLPDQINIFFLSEWDKRIIQRIGVTWHFADGALFGGQVQINKLYELIGGREIVSAAIQSFYDRVLQDDSLKPFFAMTDMKRLHAGQHMFVSMLLGGDVVYTGKNLGAVHANLRVQGLTDAHFTRFLVHFRAALEEVEVDREKAEKVIGLLESKRMLVLNGNENRAAGAALP
jgi:hemoglobin